MSEQKYTECPECNGYLNKCGKNDQGYQRYICKQCGKKFSVNTLDSIFEFNTKYMLLLKENARLKKNFERLQFFQDQALEMIKNEIYKLPKICPAKEIKVKYKYKEENAVLLFSDLQLGSLVDKTETSGLAKYDKNEFRKRIDKLTSSIYEVVKIQRNGGIPLNKLKIHVLGDIVQGEAVFPGQAFKLDTLMLGQIFGLGDEVIDRLIVPMAKLFTEIEIFCVPGNHGMQGKRGQHPRASNWDYIVYHLWQRRLANTEHIKFYISASPFLIYEMFPGQLHALIHGQQARGWLGYPYYGVDRMHKSLISLTGMYLQYLYHGHHHQPSMQDTHIGKKIGNGSLEGGSDYSVNDLLTANTPQQFFFGINEKGMTWEYWLRLAEYPKLMPDENGILTKLMVV